LRKKKKFSVSSYRIIQIVEMILKGLKIVCSMSNILVKAFSPFSKKEYFR
jgi:hypothetical protein